MSATNTSSTVAEWVRAGAHSLLNSSESPQLDAELLLAKVLGISRSALTIRHDQDISAAGEADYRKLLALRACGTPVAYLTGVREFWSLPLAVTDAVLVPRPETEILVEQALARIPPAQSMNVLDLGTGSGAIAAAIASERPQVSVTAVDISRAALTVAIGNARSLGLRNIEYRLGSWFEPLAGNRFDIILSNPPYIAANDAALDRLTAEPALALSPGPTGLEALQAIVAAARSHLNDDGWLLVEHGSGQARDVAALFAQYGFTAIRTVDDLSQKPRVTLGTAHPTH